MQLPDNPENAAGRETPHLTEHEKDILQLLSGGLTNREIGTELHLSHFTVRNYISRLLVKFEAKNRTALITKVNALRRQQHKRQLQ